MPLPEPTLTYYQLKPWEQTSNKIFIDIQICKFLNFDGNFIENVVSKMASIFVQGLMC